MKILITLIVLMLSITANAQEPSKHMKFMGIPMDCDVETFANKLVKEKGLKRESHGSTDVISLRGNFSGYKDCRFFLGGEGNKPIIGVGVHFKDNESFNMLHSQYQTLKTRLQTKYGEPTYVKETFKDYEPSTNYGKLGAIQNGDAIFETTYYLDEGIIKLEICSINYIGFIQLIYYDHINGLKENNSSIDDL